MKNDIVQFALNKLKILFLIKSSFKSKWQIYIVKLDKATIKWNINQSTRVIHLILIHRFPRVKLQRFSFLRTFSRAFSGWEVGLRARGYGRDQATKRVRSSLTWESTRDRQKCRFFRPGEQRENYVQPFNCDVCFQRLAAVPPTTKGKRNKQAFYSSRGFMNICGIKVYPRAIYIAL